MNASSKQPKAGEVWKSKSGAVRHVRDVDDDGYSVVYSRPADGHAEWRTTLMRDWLIWAVEALSAAIAASALPQAVEALEALMTPSQWPGDAVDAARAALAALREAGWSVTAPPRRDSQPLV